MQYLLLVLKFIYYYLFHRLFQMKADVLKKSSILRNTNIVRDLRNTKKHLLSA